MTASLLPMFIYPPITPHVAPTREINHLLDQSHALASKCDIPQAIKLFLKAEELWNAHGGVTKENKVYLLLYRGYLYSIYYQAAEDKTNRAAIDFAVVCYMEAIDLAESIVPHTADTVLPRIYLALDLYYGRCYEQATVLLKQAEAIVRNAEGPHSILVHMCCYNILACYVAMLQYSNHYRSGLISTLVADQLHGDKAPFPIDHKLIAELGSLGAQTFQGLGQQYKYLEDAIADQKLLEPPERKQLAEILTMGFGQQGVVFRKDVLEKIKNNPMLYEGCNSLIMFDFLQSSEFLQAGSLGICQPEALLSKDTAESKAGSPGTNFSALLPTGSVTGPRISSLTKDLAELQRRQEQRWLNTNAANAHGMQQWAEFTRLDNDSTIASSPSVTSFYRQASSAGITPPATRAPGTVADITNVLAQSYTINFPVDARAYTMDEDGLYAAIAELTAIEQAMTKTLGSTHHYTNAVRRLKRICDELQETTLLNNDKETMDKSVEAFKHKFRYLSTVEVKPKMLGSGGKPKKEKGKKGKKGKKG